MKRGLLSGELRAESGVEAYISGAEGAGIRESKNASRRHRQEVCRRLRGLMTCTTLVDSQYGVNRESIVIESRSFLCMRKRISIVILRLMSLQRNSYEAALCCARFPRGVTKRLRVDKICLVVPKDP